MAFEIFSVASTGNPEQSKRLNDFCQGHTVLALEKTLVTTNGNSHWSFCVEYLQGGTAAESKGRRNNDIDYREVLSPEDFAVYDQLRRARKSIAEQTSEPVYQVCSNAQLAAMVKAKAQTKADLLAVSGFGQARLEKYGEALLEALQKARREAL